MNIRRPKISQFREETTKYFQIGTHIILPTFTHKTLAFPELSNTQLLTQVLQIVGDPVLVDVVGVAGSGLDGGSFHRSADALLAHRHEELLTEDQQQHSASSQEQVEEKRLSVQAFFQLDDVHCLVVNTLVELVATLGVKHKAC